MKNTEEIANGANNYGKDNGVDGMEGEERSEIRGTHAAQPGTMEPSMELDGECRLSADCRIDTLPDEIISKILSFLPVRDFLRTSGTSNRFSRCAKEAENCEYWKKAYHRIYEYRTPLYHPEPARFEFRGIEQWDAENPWKESYKQLNHGVHVRPGYSELYKGGRKLKHFETLEDAIAFLETRKDETLIFLHSGRYVVEEGIIIDRDLLIIGAAPAEPNDIADHVIIERSYYNYAIIRFIGGVNNNGYLGYVTVTDNNARFSRHLYAVEVSEEASPVIEHCHLWCSSPDGAGLRVRGRASPKVRHCLISDSESGIQVFDEAEGEYEDCEIARNNKYGVCMISMGKPKFKNCRIHHGYRGVKVDGGEGLFESCEIHDNHEIGIYVIKNANPTVFRCQIHDNGGGVCVTYGGMGVLEGNDIFGNAEPGVHIRNDSRPVLRRNRIFLGEAEGVRIAKKSKGLLEENEISRNAQAGVLITTKSNPTLRRNRIFDGMAAGVEITNGATATLEYNVITNNRFEGLVLAPDVRPKLKENDLSHNNAN